MSQPVNLCWVPFSEAGLEVLQLRKGSWTVYMGLGHMQRSEQVIQQSPSLKTYEVDNYNGWTWFGSETGSCRLQQLCSCCGGDAFGWDASKQH